MTNFSRALAGFTLALESHRRNALREYLLDHTISLRLSRVSRLRACIRLCRSPPGALSRLKSLSVAGARTSLLFAASFMLDKVLLSHGQLFRAAWSSEAVACNWCVRSCGAVHVRLTRLGFCSRGIKEDIPSTHSLLAHLIPTLGLNVGQLGLRQLQLQLAHSLLHSVQHGIYSVLQRMRYVRQYIRRVHYTRSAFLALGNFCLKHMIVFWSTRNTERRFNATVGFYWKVTHS